MQSVVTNNIEMSSHIYLNAIRVVMILIIGEYRIDYLPFS